MKLREWLSKLAVRLLRFFHLSQRHIVGCSVIYNALLKTALSDYENRLLANIIAERLIHQSRF